VVVEGRFITDANGLVTGDEGDTGQQAFTMSWNADGTATMQAQAAGVGDGAWTLNDLNQVELDHANVMCSALASRSWWSAR
jgi:hypothetical protein